MYTTKVHKFTKLVRIWLFTKRIYTKLYNTLESLRRKLYTTWQTLNNSTQPNKALHNCTHLYTILHNYSQFHKYLQNFAKQTNFRKQKEVYTTLHNSAQFSQYFTKEYRQLFKQKTIHNFKQVCAAWQHLTHVYQTFI